MHRNRARARARTFACSLSLVAATFLGPAAAAAAPAIVPAPAGYQSIPLGDTGSPSTERWEDTAGWRRVFNVTQPALVPVLPRPGSANGSAIVIAPGGGFRHLSMDSEGFKVAAFLAERGIAAFVLKYRVRATPAAGSAPPLAPAEEARQRSAAIRAAEEDGLAAMRWVRGHARDYGVRPDRIGFMGFSAGGITTANVALHADAAARPDFIGVIYGSMPEGSPVPADAQPAFIAVAADDRLLGTAAIPLYEAWRAAGRDAELHIYAHGAHGFGLRPQGTSSDRWAEDFHNWLRTEIIR